MKKSDEDLRKDIEDLEKLIEEVRSKNHEELEKLKKEQKPGTRRIVKVDLGAEYSRHLPTNLIVGFLVNFILFFLLMRGLGLATTRNDFIYPGLALVFTGYETLLKRYLFQKQIKIVMYSSGLVFFLCYLVFFYLADLVVLPDGFSFLNYWYPIAFVVAFIICRFLVKTVYVVAVRAIANRFAKKK